MTDAASRLVTKTGWGVAGMLAAAQFIVVLDTTVMNVSISQILKDLNTAIVGLQTAITMYTLVMAARRALRSTSARHWASRWSARF